MYPSTVAASRKGRLVLALVPSMVGATEARINDKMNTSLQIKISVIENGDGFIIGSAGIISVFTIFLTLNAVYPATETEAIQPPTKRQNRNIGIS